MYLGGIVLVAIVTLTAVDVMPLLKAAMAGVLIMMVTKSITVDEAFENTHGRVLLVIVGSFAIGNALELTGLATWMAEAVVDVTSSGGEW